MRAWLFPGQGSQRKGMGGDLFARFPDHCAAADAVLGYSIAELCLDDPGGRLRQTQFSQPALFVVGALDFLERTGREDPPDFLAGHSLGELTALFAAGAFSFETGLRLVQQRGALMAEAGPGAMVAVIGARPDDLPRLVGPALAATVDVANHNSDRQFVLSGSPEAVQPVAEALKTAPGVRCVPLNVSGAFHSRHMAEPAGRFAAVLAGADVADPKTPVVANATARPYEPGTVRHLLARQLASPVRWWESLSYMRAAGVDDVAELGGGSVLLPMWTAACEAPAPMAPPVAAAPVAAAPVAPPAPARPAPVTAVPRRPGRPTGAETLGSAAFREDYGLRYAYLSGAMYHGIASVDVVVRMARAGLMGFFGAGGLDLVTVADAIHQIRAQLGPAARFGMNLLYDMGDPAAEQATVDLYLGEDVRFVEAAAYVQVTAPLVQFRFTGAHRDRHGGAVAPRHVLAKVSRPEVAGAFMQPPPAAMLDALVAQGRLTAAEADAARELPVSGDVCVEADSGGHTDGGVALTLVPSILRLRDDLSLAHDYRKPIRVGASGGIGAPEAVAASFVLGADFVLTGSVNQCTVEAGTSDAVKDMLSVLDVQDTAYAPAGDLFELGAKVQVVSKGTLFAARANKLYQLYRQHDSLDEIDAATRTAVQDVYFRRSFEEVWAECCAHYEASGRTAEIEKAARSPKHRMALTFKWYFGHSSRAAMTGDVRERVNFQIHSGPAMGAFNRFVARGDLEDWRDRHVDDVAERLMEGAAAALRAHWPAAATPAAVPA